MTDDAIMSATADIARHAAAEGHLPDGYRRPHDPVLSQFYEAAFVLAGRALAALDAAAPADPTTPRPTPTPLPDRAPGPHPTRTREGPPRTTGHPFSTGDAVTAQLTAVAIAEAVRDRDPARMLALIPTDNDELVPVVASLGGIIAQLVAAIYPGEDHAFHDLRRLLIDHGIEGQA